MKTEFKKQSKTETADLKKIMWGYDGYMSMRVNLINRKLVKRASYVELSIKIKQK